MGWDGMDGLEDEASPGIFLATYHMSVICTLYTKGLVGLSNYT